MAGNQTIRVGLVKVNVRSVVLKSISVESRRRLMRPFGDKVFSLNTTRR